MMMLLQCPRFLRSPSRNHTPSVIFITVSGLASEFAAKKASEARVQNTAIIHTREFFIVLQAWSPKTPRPEGRRCRLEARSTSSQVDSLIRWPYQAYDSNQVYFQAAGECNGKINSFRGKMHGS